ncbi:hypothetical protein C0993_009731, partial [Termitomyces sp. T159_Od127]
TRPWDSNPLKTTPTTVLGPEHYPANHLSNPRPSLPVTATSHCHDPLPTPRTQPRPQDSSTPKTTPTTAPGPDRYPANSPGHHRPSPPINATATATHGTPRPSPP